jgi:antitoxin CptB
MALNIRKKRLKFRCWHRGSREADLLLGTFADRYLEHMDSIDVVKLENIVDCDDQLIWDWLTGVADVPKGISRTMIHDLQSVLSLVS